MFRENLSIMYCLYFWERTSSEPWRRFRISAEEKIEEYFAILHMFFVRSEAALSRVWSVSSLVCFRNWKFKTLTLLNLIFCFIHVDIKIYLYLVTQPLMKLIFTTASHPPLYLYHFPHWNRKKIHTKILSLHFSSHFNATNHFCIKITNTNSRKTEWNVL